MRGWLGCLLLLMSPGLVKAMPPAAERLERRLATVHSLRAEFVQIREVGLTGEEIEAPGVLVFQRPHAFHLTYMDEDRQEVVVQGDSLWVYSPLEKQAILYAFDPNAPGSEVFFLFGGQGKPLNEVFAFSAEPWAGHQDALRLEPKVKDPGYPFDQMRLVVDEKGFPSLFFYSETSGDLVTMRFTHVEGNPKNIDSLIAFELPPTVEILDARDLNDGLR